MALCLYNFEQNYFLRKAARWFAAPLRSSEVYTLSQPLLKEYARHGEGKLTGQACSFQLLERYTWISSTFVANVIFQPLFFFFLIKNFQPLLFVNRIGVGFH